MNDSLAGVALGLALTLLLLRGASVLRSMRAGARLARARVGERDARALLARHGFEVLAEQPRGELVLRVDGRASVHPLRADYLVRRRGERFVAEVKTGAVAPSLDHAPTRRQILEYCAAFDVDGALLVDPESARLREIALPVPRPRLTRWRWVALGFALGALLVVVLR